MFCVCQPWNVLPKATFSCVVEAFSQMMNQGSGLPEDTQQKLFLLYGILC